MSLTRGSIARRLIFVFLSCVPVLGCQEPITDFPESIDKPDLAIAVIIASNPQMTGQSASLSYEECEKVPPIVEPIRQTWFCRFGFEKDGHANACSVEMSLQSDDHGPVWRPETRLDASTGKRVSTLVCKAKKTLGAI